MTPETVFFVLIFLFSLICCLLYAGLVHRIRLQDEASRFQWIVWEDRMSRNVYRLSQRVEKLEQDQ